MRDAVWRRSSYSGENGNCVEVHPDLDSVRDSKSAAVVLRLGRDVFDRFIAAVKEDRFGRT
jgi:hypothetical protein